MGWITPICRMLRPVPRVPLGQILDAADWVGDDELDVHLADARRPVGVHLAGRNERIESAPERGIFFLYRHVVNLGRNEKSDKHLCPDQAGVFF